MTQEEKDYQTMVQEESRQRFGKALKKLREEKGLSIRKISKQCGVSASYWSYLERGKFGPPSMRKTMQIAKALEADRDMLLAEAGHFSRELVEVLRKNPREIENAFGNIDRTDPTTLLPMIKLGVYNPIIKQFGLQRIFEKPSEEIFLFVKAFLESNDISIEKESKYFQKVSEIIELWKIDLESR